MRNSSARKSAISSSACARVRGVGPLAPVRAAYSRRHSYSALTSMPSSSATAFTVRSPRSVSSTAWRLYVSSYWRRGAAPAPLCSALFMRSLPPHRIGVRPRPALAGRSLRQAMAPVLGSAQPAYPACPLNRGNLKTGRDARWLGPGPVYVGFGFRMAHLDMSPPSPERRLFHRTALCLLSVFCVTPEKAVRIVWIIQAIPPPHPNPRLSYDCDAISRIPQAIFGPLPIDSVALLCLCIDFAFRSPFSPRSDCQPPFR